MTQPRALVGNTTDPEQVKTAQHKERLGFEQEADDLRELLALPAGRRFLWRLIGKAGVFSVTPPNATPDARPFADGAKNVGLSTLDECITADLDLFLLMQKESLQREPKNARNSKRTSRDKRDDTSHRYDVDIDETGG